MGGRDFLFRARYICLVITSDGSTSMLIVLNLALSGSCLRSAVTCDRSTIRYSHHTHITPQIHLTAVFKRSGDYTISFVVEGLNAENIDPLVFPVSVRSRVTTCGPADALRQLRAKQYVDDLV